MVRIDKAVGEYLASLVFADIHVPKRVKVPGGVKCAWCSYTVATKAENPLKTSTAKSKLKCTAHHDDGCPWRASAIKRENMVRVLESGEGKLTFGNLGDEALP